MMLNLCYKRDEDFYRLMGAEAGIPDYMVGAIYRYVEHHISPGGFLTALLSNNFSEAVGRADDQNSLCLKEWAIFIHWCVPSCCHGSRETVEKWLESREKQCQNSESSSG